jgi:hypothetical protein
MLQIIPTPERNLQEMQQDFVEQLALSYADQQLMKLIGRIPPRARIAITLTVLVAPYAVQFVRSFRTSK